MFEFMKCVVEGIAHVGVKGLLELTPGGKYVYDVGAHAIKRHREKKAQKKLEDDVKEMIGAKADVAFEAAKQAVAEAAPGLSPREQELVTQYVAGIPEAARQSLKRKEDPSGLSLPFGFTIHEPDDVVKLLPQHAPRFVPGEWVPGREDNWRLERRLGGGGFGEVWLARHCINRRLAPVAVKFCTNAGVRQKLITHEKQLIQRVTEHAGDHPNIVPLLECHLSGETPWLMYEYVDGGTLADAILDWQKLPAAERVSRAIAALHTLASAVGHCHALEPAIIHRDLKPANVLRDAAGTLRVTDFGIGGTAVEFLVAEETRGVRSVVGRLPTMLSGSYSLLYASPQQRNGDKPDPRDDVHALGVIAYQMLTGDLSAAPGFDMADDLRDAGAPDELIALIGKSVAQKAERRQKDAREWAEALVPMVPSVPAAPTRVDKVRCPACSASLKAAKGFPVGRRVICPKCKTNFAVTATSSIPAVAKSPPVVKPAERKGEVVELPFPHTKQESTDLSHSEGGEVVELPLPHGLNMQFCWIPPGTAQLGSPLAEQNAVEQLGGKKPEWLMAESEAHRGVYTSKGFWLAKYPVTQAEWHALTGENPSHFQVSGGGRDDVKGLDTTRFPVESVSWDMIYGKGGFIEKFNALVDIEKVFGKAGTFALPHEDMWEYACRGGRGNGRPFYFGAELNGTQANVDGNHPFGTTHKGPNLKRPTAVGTYESKFPHPWNLGDMHGNVWEWCENLYEQTFARVLRGGSWGHIGRYSRAAYRYCYAPDGLDWFIGLRLCFSFNS